MAEKEYEVKRLNKKLVKIEEEKRMLSGIFKFDVNCK